MTRICGPDWEVEGTSIFCGETPPVPAIEELPLSEEASAALQNLASEMSEISMHDFRSLKSLTSPAPSLEQLFAVFLKLLGHAGCDWRHARYALAHPKELVKRMHKLQDTIIVGHA